MVDAASDPGCFRVVSHSELCSTFVARGWPVASAHRTLAAAVVVATLTRVALGLLTPPFLPAGVAKCWKLVSFFGPRGVDSGDAGPKSAVGERGPVASKPQSSQVQTTRTLRRTVTSPSNSANRLVQEKSGYVPTNTGPFTREGGERNQM